MPPDVELSNWCQIAGYAICEALEDAGIEYAHDLTNDKICFIGLKPTGNMLSIRIAISLEEHKCGHGSKGNIQFSANNSHTNLLYNFNNNMDLSDPSNDPTAFCSALIESIKYFNKAQDALFELIQKSESVICNFDYNFNNEIDHWLIITGDVDDKTAADLIATKKEEIEGNSQHSLHECWCFGINNLPLCDFYDDIISVPYDELISIMIAFLKHSPGTRKFVFNGEMK